MIGVVSFRGSVLPPLAAAGQEDDNRTEEKSNHGRESTPRSDRIGSVGAAAVRVDVVLDDLQLVSCLCQEDRAGKHETYPERGKVNGHHHHGYKPGHDCDH